MDKKTRPTVLLIPVITVLSHVVLLTQLQAQEPVLEHLQPLDNEVIVTGRGLPTM